jgi:murein endopeptidase
LVLLLGAAVACLAEGTGPRAAFVPEATQLPRERNAGEYSDLVDSEPPPARAVTVRRSRPASDPPAPPAAETEAKPERAAPEPEPLPRWIVHHSLPRDTIENVAIRYGVSPHWLRRWNGMSPQARLHPSRPKKLRVRAKRLPPARELVLHEAVEGDSWDSIAREYAVFDRHLRAWNKDEIGWSLEPGERVQVWVEPMVRATMFDEGPASAIAAQIPPGGHGIGTPQAGRLAAGIQIPPGEGYHLRYPNSAWGTTYAVRHLVETLDHFHRTSGYEGTLMIGSMSFRRGGKIGPHVSHQSGRDVDIRLPMRPGLPARLEARGRNVDWDATWELLLAFAESGAVEMIFLDYNVQRRLVRRARSRGVDQALLDELFQFPRGRQAAYGLVHHSPGHEGHIHVRFACGPFEPQCG